MRPASAKPALVEEPRGGSDAVAAQRVFETAGEAIKALGTSLDGAFSRAVDTLLAVKGRVIVSGMGKSGHIGRKIAATLASTGTPAQFVHPAEASHGDLGMLTAQDALLVLSWRGETAELSDLVTYAKRFRIPLIGMASDAESTLLQASDVALVMPARARGLSDGAGADNLDDGDARAGRCARCCADGTPRLFRGPVSGTASGRFARPRPDPRLRSHAQGRRDPARRGHDADAAGADCDRANTASAASASPTGKAPLSASSPTAILRRHMGRDILDRKASRGDDQVAQDRAARSACRRSAGADERE